MSDARMVWKKSCDYTDYCLHGDHISDRNILLEHDTVAFRSLTAFVGGNSSSVKDILPLTEYTPHEQLWLWRDMSTVGSENEIQHVPLRWKSPSDTADTQPCEASWKCAANFSALDLNIPRHRILASGAHYIVKDAPHYSSFLKWFGLSSGLCDNNFKCPTMHTHDPNRRYALVFSWVMSKSVWHVTACTHRLNWWDRHIMKLCLIVANTLLSRYEIERGRMLGQIDQR